MKKLCRAPKPLTVQLWSCILLVNETNQAIYIIYNNIL